MFGVTEDGSPLMDTVPRPVGPEWQPLPAQVAPEGGAPVRPSGGVPELDSCRTASSMVINRK